MHATAEADAMADAAPSEGGDAAEATEMSGNSYAAVMNIEQIKKVLPHRHAPGKLLWGSPHYALWQAGSRCLRLESHSHTTALGAADVRTPAQVPVPPHRPRG